MKKKPPTAVKKRLPHAVKKKRAYTMVEAHSVRRSKELTTVPAGYHITPAGVIAPQSRMGRPVPVSKLRSGFRAMKRQLDDSLDELLHVLTGPYRIAAVELTVSFDVDGKFLGFGVGGATTMKLVIRPADGG